MSKANIFALMKASSEDEDEMRLHDVFKTSSAVRMFAGQNFEHISRVFWKLILVRLTIPSCKR